ncbi:MULTISPECIES: DNA polymerase I [Kocuria]|uniref:DNA polymerase I n=1 Tax=Kocuria subflava TaxID=1736139 RepID=A0A846TPB9_9MICC|nr:MULTISPECIES: DNA polymerase I [unclassified Kocuria]NKE08790.1 DNA polymerase I [Kocuria subflava]
MSDQSQPKPAVVVIGSKTENPQEVQLPVPVSRPERKLLLIDGHSLAFRAFFALSRAAEYGNGPAFVTESGEHTEAVYGFLNTMTKLMREQKPTHLVVSFDLEGPTLRSQEYGEYKGGRDETPEAFHGQVPRIQAVLEALGVPVVTKEGYEADDVLATLARRGAAADFEVLVFSGDRDAFQMVDDHVTVVYPGRTPSDLKMMDAAAVMEKYKVPPQYYPDLAALTGEQADNLPGVPGVGPGFAAKWIEAYGDVESVLEHAEKITGKKGEALRENVELVRRNRKLNRLETGLDLKIELDQAELPTPNQDAVNALFDDLDFGSGLRGRVFEAFAGPEAGPATAVSGLEVAETVESAQQLSAWLDAAAGRETAVRPLRHDDDAPQPGGREVTELLLARGSAEEHPATAVHLDLMDADSQLEQVLADWLADAEHTKVVWGFKDLWKSLHLRGLELEGVVDDIALSAYLIEPARRSYELEALLADHLDLQVAPLGDAGAQAKDDQLALDVAGESADGPRTSAEVALREAELAVASLQLSGFLRGKLENDGQTALLTGMDLPLAKILGQMELTGVAVDRQRVDALIKSLEGPIQQAWDAAQALVPREEGEPEIKLGSTKQLQTVLFETLELPPTKKIKTGYTTSAAALEELLTKVDPESPGAQFLLALRRWRDTTKLKQIVQGLRSAIKDDDRIHTDYQQTVAATGRLSSTDPNLQNIPVRSEEGRQIRGAFVVGTDGQDQFQALVTADYSQIEMRVMGHLSKDEGLIEAFRDGEDLHRYVGSKVFGVEPEDVTAQMRSKVKAMSYGLVYGLSSYGLSQQLNISVDEARTMMSDYFKRFGGVRDFLRGVVDVARENGYTETIDGRRRYLPDLTSDNRQLRQAAERMALNAPIQGSAADIIKKAMILVDREFQGQGLRSRVLMQVHDELVVEAATGEVEKVSEILRTQMGSAIELSVPLEVNVGVGPDWNAAAH